MPDPHPPLIQQPALPGPGWLLEAYVKGDPEAFTQLVRHTTPLVMAAAVRRCGGRHALAEEAAQVAFADLARRAPSLRPDATLLGWLHQRATRAAGDLMKQEQRRTQREQKSVTAPICYDANDDPSAQRWEDCRADVDDALAALRLDERTAVLLRCAEGQDFASVGAALDCSAEAARKKVTRALEKLRAALGRSTPKVSAALLIAGLTKDQALASAGSSGTGIHALASQLANSALSKAGPITLTARALPWLKAGVTGATVAAVLLAWPLLHKTRPPAAPVPTIPAPPVPAPVIAAALPAFPAVPAQLPMQDGLSLDEIVQRLAAMAEGPSLPDDFTRANIYREQIKSEETGLVIRKLHQRVTPAGWSNFISRSWADNYWIPWCSREVSAALDFLFSSMEASSSSKNPIFAHNLLMDVFSTICRTAPGEEVDSGTIAKTRELVTWATGKLQSQGPQGWSHGQQALIDRGDELTRSVIQTGDPEAIGKLLDLINAQGFRWLDSSVIYVTKKETLTTLSSLMPRLLSPDRRNKLQYSILAKLVKLDAPEAMRQVESVTDPELRWAFAKAVARPDRIIDEAAKSRADWWLRQAVQGKELECAGVIFNEWSSIQPEWIVEWMTGHFSRETALDVFQKELHQEIHNYAVFGNKDFAPGLKRMADLLRKLDPKGAEAFIATALTESARESQINAAREVLKP